MDRWLNPWLSAGDVVTVDGCGDTRYRILRSWPTGQRNPPFVFELVNISDSSDRILNVNPMECRRCES